METARWVRGMFGHVARRYDFLNHLLSLNLDRHWRARTVRRLRPVLERPGARVMDACCGTGDLLLALRSAAGATVVGSDFCRPMLEAARRKIERRGFAAALVEADALSLPLADSSFDLVTTAFGFRNLANYEKGLREMRRVLKPGRRRGHPRILAAARGCVRGVLRLLFAARAAAGRRRALGRSGRLRVPAGIGEQVSGPGRTGCNDARGGL
jgi:ubiquinone/menaquinone biosynthesis C-methylase UbiE